MFYLSVNSYRRGLQNGVIVNPKLFILEKFNLAPPTVGWSTWSNLVKLVKNLYYLVRVITFMSLNFVRNSIMKFDRLLKKKKNSGTGKIN